MTSRLTFSLAILLLAASSAAAVKPIDPGIIVLGVRGIVYPLADGSSAVQVTEVFPDSPAQRLFNVQTPPITKPYDFHELAVGDVIFKVQPTGATPPAPTVVKNVQDLKLFLHQHHGKIVSLFFQVPVTPADPSGVKELQVKLRKLPVE
ncbi:hypothetical protein NZK35_09265 [Stieleria sp. ICT_E10.1]|uniref:hypothetical protein n=1 Tax=Stieleria sedimenti TaxID=2976331 RepID=UPI00217F75C4|nr:hypothetical protein [Stieleria sedimenti]MCS7466831.1 hypothetical protein [Stieleria sedimenti]